MCHPRATKSAKEVDYEGVPQHGRTSQIVETAWRRQIDVGGSALTRVINFAINQAQGCWAWRRQIDVGGSALTRVINFAINQAQGLQI